MNAPSILSQWKQGTLNEVRVMRKAVTYVLNPDTQEPVDGLRFNKPSRRYYRIADDHKNRHFYSKNGLKGLAYHRRAIFEHECHVKGHSPSETASVQLTRPAFDQFGTEVLTKATLDEHGNHVNIADHNLDDLADFFIEQLANPETRVEWADRMRMPELLSLHKLRPNQDSMTLVDLGELYHVKNDMKKRTRTESRKFWKEFVKILGVKLVSEVIPQHIENYHDELMNRYKNGDGISRSYIRNRYVAVKATFNFAAKRGKDIQHVSEVQTFLKMLVVPKETVQQKKKLIQTVAPITPAHFHALLDVANVQWRAILLMSLNCAFYPEDICILETADVNLEKHTLQDFRCKTGKHRAAWLWPETVKSLKEYLHSTHNDPHLFVTQYGQGFKANTSLTGTFRNILRPKARIPDSVQFRHLRDGFATHSGSDLKATRIVMGLSFGGQIDKYVQRTAEAAKPACVALRKHYLGK